MSQIRFRVGDVAEIRFGVSALWETVRSMYALDDPGRHAVHRPWVQPATALAASRRLAAHVAVLRGYAGPGAWLPDFLTPAPAGPAVDIEAELARLAATPPEVIVADLTAVRRHRPPTAVARAAIADPLPALGELIEAVRAWHDAAIRPHWSRIQAVLEADIAHRSRQLAEGGARLLFDTLHPSVRWAGDRLLCDDPWGLDLDLRGRGLPLLPSVFVDRRVLWTVRADSSPVGVYPARARATTWESHESTVDSLGAVLGPTRARLLVRLGRPATTTELARGLALSAPAVSEHLRALHVAGLVTRVRQGRQVLYSVTNAAGVLLRANGLD